MSKIKVLIVDDSALIRKVLTEILSTDDSIDVVGAAIDPFDAREKIKKLNPDVLTLDIEMPKMDGITFLKNLMRLRPMPVVMISTLADHGANVTLQALEEGAIDYIPKPKIDVNHAIKDYAEEIIEKVKLASQVKPSALESTAQRHSARHVISGDKPHRQFLKTTDKIIAIGASTGGTEAINAVLLGLPHDSPGIVMAQHIPVSFSGSFANRLDMNSALRVQEAENGMTIQPGHAYLAPGNRHLRVKRTGAQYICKLDDGPDVNRHKPSVDVLFESVARNVGPNAMGVMLTGMGKDGALSMKEMRSAGAYNIAQDEATSVVWGMPGAAVNMAAVEKTLPLDNIADEIITFCEKEKM